ncbi:Protein of unknown function [Pricia antarctica]|uniref:DUF3570 domain-containing protein n=1 Tax=Pricia antarctica TaxID=641691 RepID=A0A1G7C890_9FLAO|nr:DUF3570 domain-containing protein [Pricia antarctica]SDE35423.1 Protein of unknown function [Pricia antarctica]
MKDILLIILLLGIAGTTLAQENKSKEYVKKVLDNTEVDLLYSYYNQDGSHASVSGGEGSEKLTDMTPTIIVSIPVGNNTVVTVDGGLSAYTSASSSNIDPFDGKYPASPWIESSGASRSDVLSYIHPSFSHSSKDRNTIISGNVSFSNEFDYTSFGFGGGYTHLLNQKNTEIGISAKVYLDKYNPQYPIELRPGFTQYYSSSITGDGTYSPQFLPFSQLGRNSYSTSLNFSQILSKRFQFSLSMDLVLQEGLLSTPHQRVYFADRNDFFIEDFQLTDAVEQLPNSRYKIPIGGRISYAISDMFIFRGYFRYYFDDWGINSYTASAEIPIKISDKFTIYPIYRYYTQTSSKYFFSKDVALSTNQYYTSDYDLSAFNANQYGFGISYKDIFTSAKVWKFGLKSVDLRYNNYQRNIDFNANIFELGLKFIID